MKTSVVMATYNGEKHIKEQLESILNQTRQVDEVVIVDDVSQDQTVKIVNQFIETNDLKNWVFVVNEKNLGYGQNFRKAIDLIQTDEDEDKIIFLADQDDIWIKDRVNHMAFEMERNPEIGLLNTHQQTFRDGEDPMSVRAPNDNIPVSEKIELNPYTRFLRSLGCEMVFRKSFYDKVKQHWYPEWAHDEFLWSMAILYGACYDWQYVSLYRRIHEKQVSGHLGHSKQKRINYLTNVVKSSEYLLKLSEQERLPNKTKRLFQKNVKTHQLRLRLIQNRKPVIAFSLIPYLHYYYTPKSYLVELELALKG